MFTLKRIILVTGPPGIGKTSTLRRAIKELKKRKYTVGGMICREVREGGVRVGFEIMDLSTGQRGWLAHINQPEGPKIGKYRVNLTDLEAIGVASILVALQDADILAIDEVGPMELSSTAFRNALMKAIESSKSMLGTIHYGLRDSLISNIKEREDVETLKVNRKNRKSLYNLIADKINEYLNP